MNLLMKLSQLILIKYRLKQIDTDGTFEYYDRKAIVDARNITGAEYDTLPTKCEVEQNYPNPFNPSTIINYSIAFANNVSIKVYDILGMEVETLVNEYKEPGNYKVEFNAIELVSGIYFYKIISGPDRDIKKMLLIK